eukprot:scaffold56224_cov63-Phaeocystis_antarctica.AAC.3
MLKSFVVAVVDDCPQRAAHVWRRYGSRTTARGAETNVAEEPQGPPYRNGGGSGAVLQARAFRSNTAFARAVLGRLSAHLGSVRRFRPQVLTRLPVLTSVTQCELRDDTPTAARTTTRPSMVRQRFSRRVRRYPSKPAIAKRVTLTTRRHCCMRRCTGATLLREATSELAPLTTAQLSAPSSTRGCPMSARPARSVG